MIKFPVTVFRPFAYTDLYGQNIYAEKGAIKMEKYKTAAPAGPPQQDVDDLIFLGQADAGVSQR